VVCFVGELATGVGSASTPNATATASTDLINDDINVSNSSSKSYSRSTTGVVVNTSEAIISSSPTRIVLNYTEVSECFTVSIASLLDKTKWIHRNDCAPIFVGGPYIIWGLTGYIVDRFVRDILVRYTVTDHM